MKIITEMVGVPAVGTSTQNAFLARKPDGRLCIVGDNVDVFALLRWVDQNPLAQFREVPPTEEDSKPHHLFAHMFDEDGKIPA